jgi:hypothetical protein
MVVFCVGLPIQLLISLLSWNLSLDKEGTEELGFDFNPF